MQNYKFALTFSLRKSIIEIRTITEFSDFEYSDYSKLLDGHRIYCSTHDGETLVLLQLCESSAPLKETKAFCEALRKKNLAIEEIRSYFKPVRDPAKRQSLIPIEVCWPL